MLLLSCSLYIIDIVGFISHSHEINNITKRIAKKSNPLRKQDVDGMTENINILLKYKDEKRPDVIVTRVFFKYDDSQKENIF